ncbi:glycosyltransferase [Lentzea sp. NBRC 102530]|uniref:glycosyltransferase n=1 Tax=Lentzea sp. NBRC 102530 TaxID=3032201 RepID=UPI0024A4BE64|nr:glycosyltransferase [Lentzea sp. NBRC 102530]GLY51753.1 hypothetical protein Lesp01_54090 [Lentzea sp. NBRC 102530]
MRDENAPWVRQVLPPLTGLSHTGRRVSGRTSVVVLAKDEERCVARCLDSVLAGGFDEVLVVDTGSVDGTPDVVQAYADLGVRLVRVPWPGSFAQVRNLAVEAVGTGWVVFLDADEWMTERTARELRDCLDSVADLEGLPGLVFAPRVFDVDREVFEDTIPRVLRAEGHVRFRGAVHEYPVVRGDRDEPVGVVGLDLVFHHDGYRRDVVEAKGKRQRNLALLRAARAADPANPRWLYFLVRDGLPVLSRDEVAGLCDALRALVGRDTGTGDLLDATDYLRLALVFSCQGFAAARDWGAVLLFCDGLGPVDALYFRSMAEVAGGVVTREDLVHAVRTRQDSALVSDSAVDPSGRHVDALICALLGRVRSEEEAERYRELCDPWDDVFFERSVLRVR